MATSSLKYRHFILGLLGRDGAQQSTILKFVQKYKRKCVTTRSHRTIGEPGEEQLHPGGVPSRSSDRKICYAKVPVPRRGFMTVE
jgi:hypothetical protein